MSSVLSTTCAMIAELNLVPQDWTSALPAIASALNEASMERLGKRSEGITLNPLEAMTGISLSRAMLRILPIAARLSTR